MAELLTLTEIKEYLRIDGEEENSLLTALLSAAISHSENYLQAPLPTEVPTPVKQALLILIGHFYEERAGEDIPNVVYVLLCRRLQHIRQKPASSRTRDGRL